MFSDLTATSLNSANCLASMTARRNESHIVTGAVTSDAATPVAVESDMSHGNEMVFSHAPKRAAARPKREYHVRQRRSSGSQIRVASLISAVPNVKKTGERI
jgi:hypothetical protein